MATSWTQLTLADVIFRPAFEDPRAFRDGVFVAPVNCWWETGVVEGMTTVTIMAGAGVAIFLGVLPFVLLMPACLCLPVLFHQAALSCRLPAEGWACLDEIIEVYPEMASPGLLDRAARRQLTYRDYLRVAKACQERWHQEGCSRISSRAGGAGRLRAAAMQQVLDQALPNKGARPKGRERL